MVFLIIFFTPLCFTLVYFLDEQENRIDITHYHIGRKRHRFCGCAVKLPWELCKVDLTRRADLAALTHVGL